MIAWAIVRGCCGVFVLREYFCLTGQFYDDAHRDASSLT
jgi:hypothetical protein